jgi:nucleotide-binding universal stress UspA family protein
MNEARAPRIVVGIDGSEPSQDALRWAAQQAQVTGAELVAVIAWHLPEIYAYVNRDYGEDARKALETTLDKVLDPASPVKVSTHVVEGRPASVLLEAAKDADLLVVGAHGHGAFEGMRLGSVSQHCVQHATCPVVVVRPRPR